MLSGLECLARPASVLIVERQLWTFTLKRKGPFGEEQVPGRTRCCPG